MIDGVGKKRPAGADGGEHRAGTHSRHTDAAPTDALDTRLQPSTSSQAATDHAAGLPPPKRPRLSPAPGRDVGRPQPSADSFGETPLPSLPDDVVRAIVAQVVSATAATPERAVERVLLLINKQWHSIATEPQRLGPILERILAATPEEQVMAEVLALADSEHPHLQAARQYVLSLPDMAPTRDELARICKGFGNLRAMHLDAQRGLRLRDVELLGKHPLEAIRVWQVTVDADGVEALACLAALTSISLLAIAVEAASLAPLAKLPALRSLHLAVSNRAPDDEGFRGLRASQVASLAPLTGLTMLNLQIEGLTQAAWQAIAGMHELTELILHGCGDYRRPDGLTLAALAQVRGLTRLEELRLDMGDFDLTDASLAGIVGSRHLRKLALGGKGLTGAVLQALPCPEKLEDLELKFQSALDLRHIERCEHLRALNLVWDTYDNEPDRLLMGPDVLPQVAKLSELEDLAICVADDKQHLIFGDTWRDLMRGRASQSLTEVYLEQTDVGPHVPLFRFFPRLRGLVVPSLEGLDPTWRELMAERGVSVNEVGPPSPLPGG